MKVIITGSTGMVGKGVLLECLESPIVTQILVINRKSLDLTHDKLHEVILSDLTDIDKVTEDLSQYDACFYCMGVSAVGMSAEKYQHITYETTRVFAEVLHKANPQMVFNYVSGTGTDSTEKGRSAWARVKGQTENAIFALGFKDAYAFRPGVIIPEKGIQSSTGWYNTMYKLTRPLFPFLKKFDSITTSTKVGLAMINSVRFPQENKFLENPDINRLAAQN